jgi:hypothetical protein
LETGEVLRDKAAPALRLARCLNTTTKLWTGCGGRGLAIRRDLWRCENCRRETSVMAGTIFQDSKLPLTIWFRAMWDVTTQKNGISALGLQRVLGLGSYKTAWMLLHKFAPGDGATWTRALVRHFNESDERRQQFL